MKRLFRNIIWIILLAAAGIPAGFLSIMSFDKYYAESEFMFNMIGGGIAMAVVGGVAALLTYLAMKARSEDPSKTALAVYTAIVVLATISAVVHLPFR